jgi:assimilatory nitrate reductase catalytic subunit
MSTSLSKVIPIHVQTKSETKSTCPYCGVGCGVIIETEDRGAGAQITGVRGDPDHPANFGRLCSKGSTLHLTASQAINEQSRLLYPMLRERSAQGATPALHQRMTWDKALGHAARRFQSIIASHGSDAVGFYISGQLLTEDYYVFNKLAKGQIGTNNIDTNSRLCMSSAVAGYKQSLGADAPPTCYDDVNHADCIFIVGSNTAFAHPVLFRRIEDAKTANPNLKIIFCDPRRTDTAELADLYLPIQPGTDVMLFNGMLHIMLWEGWLNTDERRAFIDNHTNGFDDLKALVRDCTPELVSQICGIKKDDLFTAAKWFSTSKATLSLYCQGLNQSTSGTVKNTALINLHLACAHIGKGGAGPFSLTGQPNAMGGREVGGLSNLLSAHRDMANPAHRLEVEELWGMDKLGLQVPSKPGLSAVELFEAAADGQVKALWIACTNPMQSMPDVKTVRRALERAEFVVLQEAFATTETAQFADLLLPATTWGEKHGTVTNSERRISRVRAAVAAPGEARHDWEIVCGFASRLRASMETPTSDTTPLSAGADISPTSQGQTKTVALVPPCEVGGSTRSAGGSTPTTSAVFMAYTHPEQIWLEHRESTRGRDLDITGLSYAALEAAPQQWPFASSDQSGLTRLYENKIFPTPDGKARFIAKAYKPTSEVRESRFPFSLTTGRLRDQWHGMSRTGTIGKLFGQVPEPVVQMNEQDMVRRGLKAGELVHVTSKRGSIILPVQASKEIGMSQAFIAMHWGGQFLSGRSSVGERHWGVNAITTSSFCPDSKQPELKHAAVKILKAELPHALLAMAWLPVSMAHTARAQLQKLMGEFDFAVVVPFGQEKTGLLFRAANQYAPAVELLEKIEAILQLDSPLALKYRDKKSEQYRVVLLAGDAIQGFLLSGDASSGAWMQTLLQEDLNAAAFRRRLLLPSPKIALGAPMDAPAKATQVCSCLNVSAEKITACLQTCQGSESERLTQLQGELQCGTECGSCVPTLKRMVRENTAL